MIGMILVTHGRLAEELRLAMEHVVGAQRNVDTVCIGPDDDIDNRRAEIEACISRCDTGDGVVLLTDMFGGTPSNLAISMMQRQGVEVIAGVNLPMLVKLAKVRSKQPLADAVNCAEEAGRKYIAAASHVLHGCKMNGSADDAAGRRTPPPDPILRHRGPDAGRRVPNKRGLHARAAAKFVMLAERFGASVDVVRTASPSRRAPSWA